MFKFSAGSACARPCALGAALLFFVVPSTLRAQTGTALVRHAPTINGTVEGSVQQMLGESSTLNGGAAVTGDLLVPGTPTVVLNGNVNYGGTLNGTGSTSPSNYQITLNGGVTLGHVVRRTNALTLPTVAAPPTPVGTRNVTINTAGQSPGDWATLKNLILNGNVGNYDVPAGTYGDFTVNGGSSITLGIPGATQAATYNFQNLTLNGTSQFRVVGPIIVTVKNGFTANGTVGVAANPSWLTLRIATGGLTLNGNVSAYAHVLAPNGTVIINGGTLLHGGVTCDRLTINGSGLLRLVPFQALNQPPVANGQSVTTPEDTAKLITLTGSDPENATLTYTILSGPTHGTLSPSGPGGAVRTYTPAANANGPDAFTFKVSDGTLDSAVATVTISVLPVNDAPEADPKSITVPEDGTVAITLSGLDVEGSPLTFAITAPPSHGSLSATTGSPVTYTPQSNYHGPDQFSYVANDGSVSSFPAVVAITVTPVNDAPVATSREVTTDEEADVATTLTGSDVDGDALSFEVVAGPSHGQLVGSPPALTYRPDVDFAQTDTFTFRAFDGQVWSSLATFLVHVNNLNDLPTAAGRALELNEDDVTAFTVTGADPDGDALTYAILTAPAHGTLLANGVALTTFPHAGLATGDLVYDPADDFHGADSFTFRTRDGQADSAPATVAITVLPINDAPSANPQSVMTDEDVAAEITLTGADVEQDPLTFAVTVLPAHGTLEVLVPGGPVFTYTPAPDYYGPDEFAFVADDGSVDSAPVVVPIVVKPINDAPVATPDAQTTPEDTDLELSLMASDVDTPAAELVFTITAPPVSGTLAPAGAAGLYIYRPAENYNGTDSFTYVVSDGHLSSAPASIVLTVTPVNDAPEVIASAFSAIHDRALVIALVAVDVDGDSLSFTVGDPWHGTLAPTDEFGGPEFVYVPSGGFVGDDEFAFSVSDGVAAPVAGTATIHVINHAPVAVDAPLLVIEDTVRSFVLTATDADPDPLTFVVIGLPQHGQLSGVAPNLIYTPGADFHGQDAISFRASDGLSESNVGTVAITVESVLDAPVATVDVSTPGGVVSTSDEVTLAVTANSVEGAITRVEFFDGEMLLGEVTSGPWELSWTPATPGVHEFWVRAHDTAGGTADSPRRIITVLAALPYVTDFESDEGYIPGNIDGQLGWTATGLAVIVAGNASSGSQALTLVGGAAIPEATQIIAPQGQPDTVFIDCFVRPVAGAAPEGAITFDGQVAILAVVIKSPALAELYVWNGDGATGGSWLATGFTFATDAASGAVSWLRLTLRKDYAGKEWDLFVNGRIIEGALRFQDDQIDRLGRLMFVGPIAGTAVVDDIYVGADNPLFTDVDHDGIDDAYEILNGMDPATNDRAGDVDGDGLTNLREFILGTHANLADSDGDGLPDSWEAQNRFDPLVANMATVDTDGDGLSDLDEYLVGTDPRVTDTDGDGMPDGWEVTFGLNPVLADGDGDRDGDGVTNADEYANGTNPNEPSGPSARHVISLDDDSGVLPGDGALSVMVFDGEYQPLSNAPVIFRVKNGNHRLSASFGGPAFSQVTVYSNQQGMARAYVVAGEGN